MKRAFWILTAFLLLSLSVDAKSFREQDFVPFPLGDYYGSILDGVWENDQSYVKFVDLSQGFLEKPMVYATIVDKGTSAKTYALLYYNYNTSKYMVYSPSEGPKSSPRIEEFRVYRAEDPPFGSLSVNSEGLSCHRSDMLIDVRGQSFFRNVCL